MSVPYGDLDLADIDPDALSMSASGDKADIPDPMRQERSTNATWRLKYE
jgi:hypothetical protein